MKTKSHKIITMLRTRGGFDAWWDEIGEDVRTQVAETIQEIIDSDLTCSDCGHDAPFGLFYAGEKQLCGPCAEKYM